MLIMAKQLQNVFAGNCVEAKPKVWLPVRCHASEAADLVLSLQ